MSASRLIVRPFLGAASRLLLDQTSNVIAPASSGQLAAALRPRGPKLSSIWLSSQFTNCPQLRFSSTNSNPKGPSEPPKAPSTGSERTPGDAFRPPPPPYPPLPEGITPPSPSSFSPPPPSGSPSPPSSESTTTPQSPPSSSSSSSSSTSSASVSSSSQSSPAPSASSSSSANASSLPSHGESQRSDVSTRFAEFMDRAQSKLFVASQRLNDLTGYSGIETLKEQVAGLETSLAAAQEALHTARTAYKTKVTERASTQREVTTLLARQKTWTPLDFERFTTLYRADYELEAEVAERARDLEVAERDAERLARDLSTAILARYHEEQIWSDKIRRMSTWGTWGLMCVNVVLFLAFQFGAEPWRRARLVRGFEEKVREALDDDRTREAAAREDAWTEFMDYVSSKVPQLVAATAAPAAAKVDEAEAAAAAAADADAAVKEDLKAAEEKEVPGSPLLFLLPSSWRDALVDPDWWREAAADLASERAVAIRMRDVSLVALEGLAAGAVLAGTIAVLCMRGA